MLGLLWQIIRIGLFNQITLEHCPGLTELLNDQVHTKTLLYLSIACFLCMVGYLNRSLINAASFSNELGTRNVVVIVSTLYNPIQYSFIKIQQLTAITIVDNLCWTCFSISYRMIWNKIFADVCIFSIIIILCINIPGAYWRSIGAVSGGDPAALGEPPAAERGRDAALQQLPAGRRWFRDILISSQADRAWWCWSHLGRAQGMYTSKMLK